MRKALRAEQIKPRFDRGFFFIITSATLGFLFFPLFERLDAWQSFIGEKVEHGAAAG